MNTYGVYILVDDLGRVVAVNSEGLLRNLDGWVRIGEYESDVPYAQGGYFGQSIMTDEGAWRYKLEDGRVVERSPEEMEGDIGPEEKPVTVQALREKIATLETALEEQQVMNGMLTECLLEMSEVVYAGQ